MSVASVEQSFASNSALDLRLDLFEAILGESARSSLTRLADHSQCIALSSGLRGELCQELANLLPRHLHAGEYLYFGGDPARSLFLLRSGLIKTSLLCLEGQQVTLKIHKPGDLIGELCLCGGGRREEAVALEASTVTELPLASLLGRLRRKPDAAMEWASMVCERLADAYEQIESFSWDTVLQRLVRSLLRLAADFGESRPAGTLTQDELAKLVGARREVVSSLLNRLRDSGHVNYSSRGGITINRVTLQAFLDARARS